MSRTLFLAGALALGIIGIAAPAAAAQPLDGACLWASLPKARQASLLSDYVTKGVGEAENSVEETDFENFGRDCGVTPETEVTAGQLVIAVLLEKGSVTVLAERHRTPADTMPAVWAALDLATQRKLTALARAVLSGNAGQAEQEYMLEVIAPIMTRLKLDGAAAATEVAAYLLGRALRAGIESDA